jgi:hypothetical protein
MAPKTLTLVAIAWLALVPALLAQGGRADAKKDNDKEVAELIKQMKADVAAKKDDEAIKKMDQLLTKFPECGPKDKQAVADAIGKNLEAQRLPAQDSKEQPKLFVSSVMALGQLGEHGSKILQPAYEIKDWKKDIAFRGKILQAIGSTKDVNAVEFLIKKLEDKDHNIVADTSTALGHYTSAKEDVRKKIVEKLVKTLNSAQGAGADPSTPQGAEMKRRYETIAPSMIDSLQKLTNQSLREPREWESWWNKNKSKPWA